MALCRHIWARSLEMQTMLISEASARFTLSAYRQCRLPRTNRSFSCGREYLERDPIVDHGLVER